MISNTHTERPPNHAYTAEKRDARQIEIIPWQIVYAHRRYRQNPSASANHSWLRAVQARPCYNIHTMLWQETRALRNHMHGVFPEPPKLASGNGAPRTANLARGAYKERDAPFPVSPPATRFDRGKLRGENWPIQVGGPKQRTLQAH